MAYWMRRLLNSRQHLVAFGLLGIAAVFTLVSVTATDPPGCHGADAKLQPAAAAAILAGIGVSFLPKRVAWRVAVGLLLALGVWIVLWSISVASSDCFFPAT